MLSVFGRTAESSLPKIQVSTPIERLYYVINICIIFFLNVITHLLLPIAEFWKFFSFSIVYFNIP